MEESQKNLVAGLEHLMTICKDGEKGYHNAAENAKDEDLKSLFNQYSKQRNRYITELSSLISSLGGDPDQSSGASGALHRAWIDIKESLSGHDRKALLQSCETGEHAALEAFRNFFSDVFEYTNSPTTHSLYTITGGTNRNYESTGMDSGNGLYNGSEGYSNVNRDITEANSDYSSTSDPSDKKNSQYYSSNSGNSDENKVGINNSNLNKDSNTDSNTDFSGTSLDNRLYNSDPNARTRANTESPLNDKVYSIVKNQLDGIQEAHDKVKSLRDLDS